MLEKNRFPIDITIQSLNNQSLYELLLCLSTIFARNALTVRVVTTTLCLQLREGCVFIISCSAEHEYILNTHAAPSSINTLVTALFTISTSYPSLVRDRHNVQHYNISRGRDHEIFRYCH